MSRMELARYMGLGAHAGGWLAPALGRPFLVDELEALDASPAVYVVEDALEHIVYVGSVCRAGQVRGVASRMREHLRDPLKRLTWHRVWVLPLVDDTPLAVVRRIEGAVGVDLAPLRNQRLPAL